MPKPRFSGSSWSMRLLAETDLAARQRQQAGDAIERRRLAAAGWAEQRDELARLDRKVDAVEGVVGAEGPAQSIEFEAGIVARRQALRSGPANSTQSPFSDRTSTGAESRSGAVLD